MSRRPARSAALKDAERRLKEARAEAAAVAAERRLRRLKESTLLDYDWVGPYQDLVQRQQAEPGWFPIGNPSARRHGVHFPFFQTEQQLGILRDLSRVTVGTNNHAEGLLNGLTSFVVGTGFKFKVTPRGEAGPAGAAAARAVTGFLDGWARAARWGERQQEAFRRLRVDGDCFLRLFADDGLLKVRFVWPEQVVMRPGGTMEEDGFGITTDPDDIETVLGYWVCRLGDISRGDEVDPADVVHLKANSWTGVKRGLPDFCFATQQVLDAAARLARNLGEGNAVRAAIAMIRQHAAATEAEVSEFVAADRDFQVKRPFSAAYLDSTRLDPGTVIDIPDGMEHAGAPADPNTADATGVVDLLVRSACARWNAPEWLGSSNAANMGAYTSSLVAESPFVKSVVREQEYLRVRFLAVIERALEVAAAAGELDAGALGSVDVDLVPPSPETRDKQAESQRAAVEIPLGVQSRQNYCSEQGRDFDRIAADNQQYQDATGADGEVGADGSVPDEGGDEGRGDPLTESLPEARLLESGYTGVRTDSLGREVHFVDGKRVAAGDAAGERAARDAHRARKAAARRARAGRTADEVARQVEAAGEPARRWGLDGVAAAAGTALHGVLAAGTPREAVAAIRGAKAAHRAAAKRATAAVAAEADRYAAGLEGLAPKARREAARDLKVAMRLGGVPAVGDGHYEDAEVAARGGPGARRWAADVLRDAVGSALDHRALAAELSEWAAAAEPTEVFERAWEGHTGPGPRESAADYRARLAGLGAGGLPDPDPGETAAGYRDRDEVAEALYAAERRVTAGWLAGFARHVRPAGQGDPLAESLDAGGAIGRALAEHGFTGTDRRGVRWVDGKEVKSAKPAAKGKPAAKAKPTPAAKPAAPKAPKPPRVREKKPSARALRARAAHHMVDASIQRYAEEHNEPQFAKAVGGLSFKDNEPVDVVVGDGGVVRHGIELKTMVSNKAAKITMKRSAMERKAQWEKDNKAAFHTVVIDDQAVYNANGEGQHDESKRRILYRRGYGSFRVGTMYEVKDVEELRALLDTPNDQLPDAARGKA